MIHSPAVIHSKAESAPDCETELYGLSSGALTILTAGGCSEQSPDQVAELDSLVNFVRTSDRGIISKPST